MLVVYYIVAANIEYGSIGLLTWSMWFVAFCWFFTPFWFNPLAFDWSKTLRDFEDWTEWMKREVRALHNSTVQPACLRAPRARTARETLPFGEMGAQRSVKGRAMSYM